MIMLTVTKLVLCIVSINCTGGKIHCMSPVQHQYCQGCTRSTFDQRIVNHCKYDHIVYPPLQKVQAVFFAKPFSFNFL